MHDSQISRRTILQVGGTAGLAAALGLAATGPAGAATPASAHSGHHTQIVDLGPAVVQFSLMSGVVVGDTMYIGSRNLDPVSIVALHLPTKKVVATTTLGTGHSIQALAADPSGNYIYAGVLQHGDEANLYRWDITTAGASAELLGKTGDRDVRDLSVAPDGRVYAVGEHGPSAPCLYEYDPAAKKINNLGMMDAKATGANAVVATANTVFVGSGSFFNGGGGASQAALFAYDRAQGTFARITPPELAKMPSIRELAVFDGKLAVGTTGSLEPSKIALMDLADYSKYSVTSSVGKTAKKFAELNGNVYFASESSLMAYSISTNAVTAVDHEGPRLGEIWGVDARDGKVYVTSAFGFVAAIDPVSRTSTLIELAQAGAPAGPQTAMGLAAGSGNVYVSGSGSIAWHRLRSGEVTNLRAPGEAKDAVFVNGKLYTGQYSSEGIWCHDPRSGAPIMQLAKTPSAQNRPLDVHWDDDNKLVLVGAQSDTEGGGSLWTHSPRTGKTQVFVNPIDDRQLVRAVATHRGVAFLGGGFPGAEGPGTIVAFDPAKGKELWRMEPQTEAGISALSVEGKYLYLLTRKGALFVIDVRSRKVVHTADISSVTTGFAAMVTNRGAVYGVSETTLFRFDPKTFAMSVVVPAINGGWYSGTHLTNDEHGYIYTLRGRNLVQIKDQKRR